jgi:hypothetical protein
MSPFREVIVDSKGAFPVHFGPFYVAFEIASPIIREQPTRILEHQNMLGVERISGVDCAGIDPELRHH